MATNVETLTGNPIVDAIGKINITENIIPESWYQTIVSESGKVNTLAILILSDIVYWYRPTEVRNEDNLTTSYTKKFKDADYLQRSYQQLMDKFNISKDQAKRAVTFLEGLGVVIRHFKTIDTPNGPLPNVMYLELVPEVLLSLTYPSEGGVCKNPHTPVEESSDAHVKTDAPICKKPQTNTKTTTEIKTNISTTTPADKMSPIVVDEINEVFGYLGLSEQDISAIAKASDYDIEKCKKARTVLESQTKKIGNVAGWLIAAIKGNFEISEKAPAKRKNSFHNFNEREYDYAELERSLLRKGMGLEFC